MRLLIIILSVLFCSSSAISQARDTIFINTKTTTIVRFKGANVLQYDLTGSLTSSIQKAGQKDVLFLIDSAAGLIKFRALRPFTNRALLTAIFDTAFQYYIKYSETVDKGYYEFYLPTDISAAKNNKAKNNEAGNGKGEKGSEEIKEKNIPPPIISTDGIDIEKRKLFASVRARSANMNNVSAFNRDISMILSKIFQKKEKTCFTFVLANHLRSDVQLSSIEVSLVEGANITDLNATVEETAFATLGKWGRTNFSVIIDNLTMSPGSKLVFTAKHKDGQYPDLAIEVKQKKVDSKESIY